MIGPEIVEETTEKIKFLKEKMKEAQDRAKNYADKRRKDLEFAIDDLVYLKMITFKGRVRISGRRKLDPRYLGPFKIIERVGKVAYKLELPTAMDAFHNVFHVSQLKKCLTDQDVIVPEIPSDLGTNLTLETRPVRILDRMEKAMRKKTIQMVKIVWDCSGREEITWETEARMKADYPEWFNQFMDEDALDSDSRTNPLQVGETCRIPDPE